MLRFLFIPSSFKIKPFFVCELLRSMGLKHCVYCPADKLALILFLK